MSNQRFELGDGIVTSAELAKILGFSTARIRQLEAEKAFKKVGHGKYNLNETISSYVEYKERLLVEDDADLDKLREETLWIRARRLKSEAEYNIMSGDLHRSSDVEAVMNKMMEFFRSQLLSFPTRSAPKVCGEKDINVVREVLKDDIKEVMQVLSDYDPNIFYDQSDDKIFVESPEEAGIIERK